MVSELASPKPYILFVLYCIILY